MNRRFLKVRQRANQDIDEISERIAEDNLDAAIGFVHAVRREFDLLTLMPGIGQLRENAPEHLRGLRSTPIRQFRNYVIFFLATTETVEIIRVLDGRRNVDAMISSM